MRVHVCPYVQRVYIFPTSKAIDALDSGNYNPLNGHQDGVEGRTSVGYNVPPKDIEECIALTLRNRTWEYLCFKRSESTNIKGRKAIKLVTKMIHRGMLPLPADTERNPTLDVQGTDIFARFPEACLRIQVKCDFKGGAEDLGGYGLFLQTHERNPLGRHDGGQAILKDP